MMKAPADKRPTWRGGIIQIHITRACDLSCVSCTQGSNLAGKPTIITLDNFQLACESLKDYHGVIGIFGGNPTLHPQFTDICHILQSIIPFEQRGLWSNNLNGKGQICRETFNPAVSNLNVHGLSDAYDEMKRDWPESIVIGDKNDSRHSPPFVAMRDLGYSDSEIQLLIEKCDVNQLWSAMVCQFRGELRGFFCELAGAQSMLHESEPDYPDTGIDVKSNKDWWKLPIESFDNQIKKHCWECGIPLKLAGDLSQGTDEFVSTTHQKIYQLKRPKGKTIHLVSKQETMKTVTRATDYVQNGIQKMTSETKVLVGVPTCEMARRADFYDYFNALDKPAGTLITFCHGQSPARNRNMIIEQALQQGCSHILFLDDDVTFRPNMLNELLKHDKDIVTGLYLMRNYPHLPIIFDVTDKDGRCRHHFLEPGEKGLIEIVATGLGACLIKIGVFQKMIDDGLAPLVPGNKHHSWVRLGELEPDHWCDDIGFFQRVREAGFKLYCDLDVLVGHIATMIIWPDVVNGQWMSTVDTNSPYGRISTPQYTADKVYPPELAEKSA